jgi:predicted nucleic-acid-binding protein
MMIGIDTNVLLRLIVEDDVKQARLAQKSMEKHCSEEEPGFINSIVLVEIVWVLERSYKYSRIDIVSALEAIFQVKELSVQSPNEAWEALHQYRNDEAGFADLYIGAINRSEKCITTLTFDKKAASSKSFQLVS